MPSPAPFSAPVGLVPALDAPDIAAMLRIVDRTACVEGMAGYKLGLSGVLRLGLAGAVKALREATDLPIIYDHQKAGPDMAGMAGHFTAICGEAGLTGLILFPVAGPRAVHAFTTGALEHGMLPIVGGHIPEPDYRVSDGGYIVDNVLLRIIGAAAADGARHFVLPANEPATIRDAASWLTRNLPETAVFLTGIGALGGTIQDAFAAAAGCRGRFAIVGRGVAKAGDPAEAAKRLIAEMHAVT